MNCGPYSKLIDSIYRRASHLTAVYPFSQLGEKWDDNKNLKPRPARRVDAGAFKSRRAL